MNEEKEKELRLLVANEPKNVHAWIEDYCLVGNRDCVRYKMEEDGIIHPNNLLPNGKIRKSLI
jgi:hypothetical protein